MGGLLLPVLSPGACSTTEITFLSLEFILLSPLLPGINSIHKVHLSHEQTDHPQQPKTALSQTKPMRLEGNSRHFHAKKLLGNHDPTPLLSPRRSSSISPSGTHLGADQNMRQPCNIRVCFSEHSNPASLDQVPNPAPYTIEIIFNNKQ